MSKWLATSAALAVMALIAIPDGAAAAEPNAAGIGQSGDIEVSAARRHRRSQTRVTVRPDYRYRWRYHAQYHPHPFDLYSRSRPFFVPGPPKGAMHLRRDGMGTGAYGFGYN